MAPKTPRKYTIRLDKTGRRYVKVGNKKIIIKEQITDTAFLKWLTMYLTKKRKRRKSKAKAETLQEPGVFQQRDLSELPAHLAADEGLRNLTNKVRESLGKPLLAGPYYPGGPPAFIEHKGPIPNTPIAAIEGPR